MFWCPPSAVVLQRSTIYCFNSKATVLCTVSRISCGAQMHSICWLLIIAYFPYISSQKGSFLKNISVLFFLWFCWLIKCFTWNILLISEKDAILQNRITVNVSCETLQKKKGKPLQKAQRPWGEGHLYFTFIKRKIPLLLQNNSICENSAEVLPCAKLSLYRNPNDIFNKLVVLFFLCFRFDSCPFHGI